MKKVLVGLLLSLLAGGLSCCDIADNNYKDQKCVELNNVYEELDYKEYSLNNWNLAKEYIVEGKTSIMLCDSNKQVDEIYDEIILKISQIKKCADKYNVLDFKEITFKGYALVGDYKKVYIINDSNEFAELFNNKDIFGDYGYNSILNNYTSDYFKDKTILVYLHYAQSSDVKRYINEVAKFNNIIKIQMNAELYDDSLNDDEFVIPWILEFNKNDISSECNVEFYEKYKVIK